MPEDEYVNPAVRAAVDADGTIKPEARHLVASTVSKAIGRTTDPDVAKGAVDLAMGGAFAKYREPVPDAVQPGSLSDVAARFATTRGPQMGLTPVDAVPTSLGVAAPHRAPAPVPMGLPPVGDQLAAFAANREACSSWGLSPIKPDPKGS